MVGGLRTSESTVREREDNVTLRIGPRFSLPDESVAQTFGILGMKGSGKSNAAVVMAEEMFERGIPWVAIDPKGDWYGIRSSRTGKGPGLPLPVFGGIHGDVPLHADGGALLADLIIDVRLTCVVDVSEFTKGEQTRFLVDMADRLFRRQRRSPEPMHLFLEEAHEYLPQRVMRDQAVLVGLWSRIVKQGRSFGLGVTVASQRSASLNKDVLTQVGTLIAMRVVSPQDRKAIKDWVEEYDVDREMLTSLPELEDGEAWFWSPQFLKTFKRMRFRMRETFDSGATPKLGQTRVPKTLADIDVKAIEKKWAESIERAKEEDPRELKKIIRNLEVLVRDLETRMPEETQVEVEVVPEWVERRVGDLHGDIDKVYKALAKVTEEVETLVVEAHHQRELRPRTEREPIPKVSSTRKDEVSSSLVPAPDRRLPAPSDGSLSKMQRKILSVLAQHGSRTTDQLLLQTGYRIGGAWNTALSRLRANGYITQGSPVKATNEGLDALGHVTPLPTGSALLDYWKESLGQMVAKIIDALIANEPLYIDQLLTITNYKVGGAWNTALSRLRKLNIITTGAPIKLTDDFRNAIR